MKKVPLVDIIQKFMLNVTNLNALEVHQFFNYEFI